MSEGARDPDILIGAWIGPLVSFDTHSVRNNKLKSLAPNKYGLEKIKIVPDLIT